MNINETTNFTGQINAKDSNGVDTQVVYLNATLDTSTNNFNISASINPATKALLTNTATNATGETIQIQYSAFETEVKTKAKSLGYVIF